MAATVDDPNLPAVCCLCGDVGFPANLFRCANSCNRLQHSYCSNYYGESAAEAIEVCDWCRTEERSGRRTHGRRRKSGVGDDKITHHRRDDGVERERNSGGVASPRPAPRRYKLLKDVMN